MREKPMLLKLYETLDCLGALLQENQGYLSNLRKGYEGERGVDELFERLTCPHLYLADRLLETNRQTFQLDSVLITGKGVFLYEIKNYRGEYSYEDNRIKHYRTGKTILKPSTQLERAETFFHMFQEEFGITIPVKTYVIFIHPEFTLYQMPPNQNILLPSLLNTHLTLPQLKQ